MLGNLPQYCFNPPEDLSEKDIKTYRLILFIAIIVHFGLGVGRNLSNERVIDPMVYRYIISAMGLTVLIGSFRNEWFKNNIINLLYFLGYIVSIHMFYILYVNDFMLTHLIGFFLLLIGVSIIFNHVVPLRTFLGFMNLGLILTCLIEENPLPESGVLISVVATISVVIFLTSRSRIRANMDLARTNEMLTEEIAHRKQVEENFLRTNIQLSEAQSLSMTGSWEWDIVYNKMTWSDEMFRIFGHEPNSFSPGYLNYFQYVPEKDREEVEAILDKAMEEKKPFEFYHRFLLPTGELRFMHARGKPVMKWDKIVGLRGTAQDVTEIKRVEEELKNAKENAERSEKFKEQFLANVSHEIRTPLNAILGFTKLLLEKGKSSEELEYLNAIESSGENLLMIINDILDFSKLASGKIEFENIEFDLMAAVESSIQLFSPKAGEKRIELSLRKDEKIPVTVMGDGLRLKQILINLIGNSIKFTPEGGKVQVGLRLSSENSEKVGITFTVTDTGVGIPKDKLNNIFESFTQASSETTRKYGGTGLGLSITKQLVELQGGRVFVESKLKVGSTFSFYLEYPLVKKGEKVPEKKVYSAPVMTSDEKLKVLLVEDNLLNQKLATVYLNKWNMDFSVADNGKKAVDLVSKERFDVILMDLQMPVMDGYEAAGIIKNNLKLTTPIIAMTAHAIKGEEQKCAAAGMDAYLSKPFEPSELKGLIYEMVGRTATREASEKLIEETNTVKEIKSFIDLAVLEKNCQGDRQMMKDLVNLFQETTPKEIRQLEEIVLKKDWPELKKFVHKVKSNMRIMGIRRGYDLIEEIENLIQNNKTEALQDLSAELKKIMTLSLEEMKDFPGFN